MPCKRFAKDVVLIVDGILVPTRDHTIAERSKNYQAWEIFRDCRLKGEGVHCAVLGIGTTLPSPDRSAGHTSTEHV